MCCGMLSQKISRFPKHQMELSVCISYINSKVLFLDAIASLAISQDCMSVGDLRSLWKNHWKPLKTSEKINEKIIDKTIDKDDIDIIMDIITDIIMNIIIDIIIAVSIDMSQDIIKNTIDVETLKYLVYTYWNIWSMDIWISDLGIFKYLGNMDIWISALTR